MKVLVVFSLCLTLMVLVKSEVPRDHIANISEGKQAILTAGKFHCPQCNTSADCTAIATVGKMQTGNEWKLWKSDSHYKDEQLSGMKICIWQWMIGCNCPTAPCFCNSFSEVCIASSALFDEEHRLHPYEICSTEAFMNPGSVTLVITIPLFLSIASLCLVVITVHYAFIHGYATCPPQLGRLPIMLLSALLIAYSFLTFFSPYFTTGIAGVFVAVLALISHTIAHSADITNNSDKSHRWLSFAAFATIVVVYTIWGAGYPNRAGLSADELGAECSKFYGFFVIDQKLTPPGFNKEVKYWGYCEREFIADTLWNVTAVIWVGLIISAVHLYTLAAKTTTVRTTEQEDFEGRVAGGPGTFLVSRASAGNRRWKEPLPGTAGNIPSVQSYSDVRVMLEGG
eukprot:TRINITY_DN30814_c0_g1_i1.p1 TRINITY_DN30814_c0_g1~~TRINITY_DN30814_c0_g1_i1.p1  ORF type:complete len:398 (+),score=40.63 TRINITY_DN30814_c0_g1_i1:51-1244(+)